MTKPQQQSAGDERSLSTDTALDRLADEFEAAWKAGERPIIEDYLARVDSSKCHEVFEELLRLEVELQRCAGQLPVSAEYRQRFPEFCPTIERLLNDASVSTRRPANISADSVPTTDFGDTSKAIFPAGTGRATAEPVPMPEQIGRFQILALLGGGGFGDVYRARDEELDREVALKLPRAERFGSEGAVARFLDEARLAAGLKHPGIVTIYDVGRDAEGRPYVVMELVAGETLEARLKAGRLPTGEAVRIMAAVADALHYAHKQGLVHRDIKPANILLDEHDAPQVADFGLAVHERDQRRRAGEISGSASYMSPEQVRGEVHRADGRVDIWALGVILYRALTGRLPFDGATSNQIFDEVLHREPKPPRQIDDSIPVELERICLKCLAKPVAERYTTAADLAADLRRALSPPAATPQTEPPVAFTPAPQPAKGRRRLGPRSIRWLVGCALALTLAWLLLKFFGGPIALQSMFGRPQQQANPVAGSQLVRDFRVFRYHGENVSPLGEIGAASPAAMLDDDVRVSVQLAAPRYCYLLALNPDGSVQLCVPENEETVPARVEKFDFPTAGTHYFGLTDGAGLQAFVLIASEQPLPPYRQWKSQLDGLPWRGISDAAGAWSYEAGGLVPLGHETRGEIRKHGPVVLQEACDFLKGLPGVTTVNATAFPVQNSTQPEAPQN